MKATTIIFTALLAVASVGAAAIPRPAADSVPGDEIAKPGLCAIPEGCGKAVARIGQGGHQKREDEDESKEEEVVVHDGQ
ncbi:hypothetical protein MMC21_004654 [Puttea exsequens]|nr:hypothetical protein [Puttea exsequens]